MLVYTRLGPIQIIGLMLCLGIPTLLSDRGCSFHIPKLTVLGTFFFPNYFRVFSVSLVQTSSIPLR